MECRERPLGTSCALSTWPSLKKNSLHSLQLGLRTDQAPMQSIWQPLGTWHVLCPPAAAATARPAPLPLGAARSAQPVSQTGPACDNQEHGQLLWSPKWWGRSLHSCDDLAARAALQHRSPSCSQEARSCRNSACLLQKNYRHPSCCTGAAVQEQRDAVHHTSAVAAMFQRGRLNRHGESYKAPCENMIWYSARQQRWWAEG